MSLGPSSRAAAFVASLLIMLAGCGGGTTAGVDPGASSVSDADGQPVDAGAPLSDDFDGTAVVLVEDTAGEMTRFDFSTGQGCVLTADRVQISMGDLAGDHMSLTKLDPDTVMVQFTVGGVRWEAVSGTDDLAVTDTTATWVGNVSGGPSGNEEVLGSVEVFC